MKVPFLRPDIRPEDLKRMQASIKTGWLVFGKQAATFEKNLARYTGRPSALMTSSCTSALHLSLILAGVGEGDEVITTPLSWVSTSDVIIYQGAKVVFVDVDPETGMLNPEDVEKKITPKTKAILLVHLYGHMADMKGFGALSKKYNIPIIEDTAHALEASRDGIRPGQNGFSACLSFHAAKNITAGQGGAILLSDASLETRAKTLRRNGVLGRNEHRRKFELGYKYDATDFQAALLIGQLARIKSTHAARLKVFKRYTEAFKKNPKISFPKVMKNVVHGAHMFVIWVEPLRRDAIRDALTKKGVETSIHYDPIHLEPFYQKMGYKEGDFPVAERLGHSTITLPTYGKLTKKEQDYVIKCVNEVV